MEMWINIHGGSSINVFCNCLFYGHWADNCILCPGALSSFLALSEQHFSKDFLFFLTPRIVFFPHCFLKLLNRCCFDCTARLSSALFCCRRIVDFPTAGWIKTIWSRNPCLPFPHDFATVAFHASAGKEKEKAVVFWLQQWSKQHETFMTAWKKGRWTIAADCSLQPVVKASKGKLHFICVTTNVENPGFSEFKIL